MLSVLFPVLRVVVEDQTKTPTSLQIALISLTTTFIIAVSCAALHLQRRKAKPTFGHDPQHQLDVPLDTYPVSKHEEPASPDVESHPRSHSLDPYHNFVRSRARSRNDDIEGTASALPTPKHGTFTHPGHPREPSKSSSGSTCSDTQIWDGDEGTDADTLVHERRSEYRETLMPPSTVGSGSPSYVRDSFHLDGTEWQGSVVMDSDWGRRLTRDMFFK